MTKRTFAIAGLSLGLLFTVACGTPKHKKAYMRHTYRNIKKSVKNAEVTKLNDTIKVLFPLHLMFQVNSTSIDSSAQPAMKRFANALIKYNRTSILISGYTDSVGTDDYNNVLSSQRADTARRSLEINSVSPERMFTWGMGERRPIASNETEEGRSRNRRVEFVVLYKSEK